MPMRLGVFLDVACLLYIAWPKEVRFLVSDGSVQVKERKNPEQWSDSNKRISLTLSKTTIGQSD